MKTHGNFNALLIIDNCSAHKDLDDSDVARKFGLLDKLCIFLLPNLTSHIQPADMGIITVLKVGYKSFTVRRLLAVYEDQNHTEIYTSRKGKNRVCKGMAFVGKSSVLDAA